MKEPYLLDDENQILHHLIEKLHQVFGKLDEEKHFLHQLIKKLHQKNQILHQESQLLHHLFQLLDEVFEDCYAKFGYPIGDDGNI